MIMALLFFSRIGQIHGKQLCMINREVTLVLLSTRLTFDIQPRGIRVCIILFEHCLWGIRDRISSLSYETISVLSLNFISHRLVLR